MKRYDGEYVCNKCKKLNHKFLRCLCWAKDDSDWPHKDKHYDYSFVATCPLQIQWVGEMEGIESDCHHNDRKNDWGFNLNYIPEVIIPDCDNPFEHIIWTPEGVAYNLKHAVRIVNRGTEKPEWDRYHVWRCGNISEECYCCCGDSMEEDEFYTPEEMRERIGNGK